MGAVVRVEVSPFLEDPGKGPQGVRSILSASDLPSHRPRVRDLVVWGRTGRGREEPPWVETRDTKPRGCHCG